LARLIVAGDARELDRLLAQGGNPSAIPPDGEPLLTIAVRNRQWECLRVLLLRGAEVNTAEEGESPPWETALTLMQYEDDGNAIEQFIRAGVSVENRDADGCTALMHAASSNLVATRRLIALGADPDPVNDAGLTALMYACATDSTACSEDESLAIVESLLQAGANPSLRDTGGRSALDIALSQEFSSAVTHRIIDLLKSRMK
jgi:ankyrin repeat protein